MHIERLNGFKELAQELALAVKNGGYVNSLDMYEGGKKVREKSIFENSNPLYANAFGKIQRFNNAGTLGLDRKSVV